MESSKPVGVCINIMKIAILGAKGYLGLRFTEFKSNKNIIQIPISRSMFNYHDPIILRQIIRGKGLDGILNCAGFTGRPNVDNCEEHKDMCYKLNVELPETIAKVCFDEKKLFFQIGSGCIYQGGLSSIDPSLGYKEEDEPNLSFDHPPCSYYSGTKAEMEKRIRKVPGVSIFRLRMPFSSIKDDRNLICKLAKYQKILEASNSITFIDEFISKTLGMIASRVPSGIYNVTNPGVVSNLELAKLLWERKIRHSEPKVFETTQDIKSVMRSPRSSCVLDSSKIASLGFGMSNVHEALNKCINQMDELKSA